MTEIGRSWIAPLFVAALLGMAFTSAQGQPTPAPPSSAEVIDMLVDAWNTRSPKPSRSLVVKVSVASGDQQTRFTIRLDGAGTARWMNGQPSVYDFGYSMDATTLRRLRDGEINILTAMASDEEATPPLVTRDFPTVVEGAKLDRFTRFSASFWSGSGPTVLFNEAVSRVLGGISTAILDYDVMGSTAWHRLSDGMRIGAQESQRAIASRRVVVALKGLLHVRLENREFELAAGRAVVIHPGQPCEIWAPPSEAGEILIISQAPGEGSMR